VRRKRVSWPESESSEPSSPVIDLLITAFTVSLHLYSECSRRRSANRLIRLPINPELGGQDPNFRLLRVMKDAGQAEIDRQIRERRLAAVCQPEAVDLADLDRFPALMRNSA
jgi:hypothetical protein